MRLKEAARDPAYAVGSYAGRDHRFDSVVKHVPGALREQDLKLR